MGNILQAVRLIKDIANDPSHGYDQDTRTGGVDFDCSSLVTYVLNQSGFDITFGLTTHNMLSPLLNIGYRQVQINAPCKLGDIFLNVNHHVCMVVELNPVKVAEATHNETGGYHGGQTGDQLQTTPYGVEDNNGEIHIRNLYTYSSGWDYHLQIDITPKTWITGNRYLSLNEMKNNAEIIYNYFIARGWTANAICAMLGNMQAESTINPTLWENFDPYNGGYGLVQWTPYTKLSNWATDWQTNHNKQLDRIIYELEHGLQWVNERGDSESGSGTYYQTFADFSKSTDLVTTLANQWLYKYEFPSQRPQPQRQQNALNWFMYFKGYIPPTPTQPETRRRLPPWLMYRTTKR